MPLDIKIKSVATRNGVTRIRHGKSETEIPGGKAGLRQWVRERVQDAGDTLLALALMRWLKIDPQMDSPDLIEGKTLSFDLDGKEVV